MEKKRRGRPTRNVWSKRKEDWKQIGLANVEEARSSRKSGRMERNEKLGRGFEFLETSEPDI